MKNQLLVLSILAMALFSCDKTDEEPTLTLDGTYESNLQTSDEAPRLVTEMTFSPNGNLLIERFSIAVGSDERCLNSYAEGTYLLEREEYTETITVSFGPDPAAFDISGQCTPKSQLVRNSNPNGSVFVGSLILDDPKENFLLRYPCNDMTGLSNCLGDQTFKKVK